MRSPAREQSFAMSRRNLYFASFCAIASLAFGKVLCQWAVFAWKSDLFSYVLLVPFVSAIVTSVSLADQRIEIDPPEGLLELG